MGGDAGAGGRACEPGAGSVFTGGASPGLRPAGGAGGEGMPALPAERAGVTGRGDGRAAVVGAPALAGEVACEAPEAVVAADDDEAAAAGEDAVPELPAETAGEAGRG